MPRKSKKPTPSEAYVLETLRIQRALAEAVHREKSKVSEQRGAIEREAQERAMRGRTNAANASRPRKNSLTEFVRATGARSLAELSAKDPALCRQHSKRELTNALYNSKRPRRSS